MELDGCGVRRPELTAERFKSHGSKRLFRSGDLANATGAWWVSAPWGRR